VTAASTRPWTLLEFAELDAALLEDPDNRVPYERLLRLWVAASRESGDEHLGLHAAAQVRPEDYELLGYLVRTCPSAADLLTGVTRWQRLLADAIEIRPGFEGERIRVHYGEPSAFHRAFKRWTNQTPAACRAQGA